MRVILYPWSAAGTIPAALATDLAGDLQEAAIRAASITRARWSRERIVPTGHPMTSAASS